MVYNTRIKLNASDKFDFIFAIQGISADEDDWWLLSLLKSMFTGLVCALFTSNFNSMVLFPFMVRLIGNFTTLYAASVPR